MIRYYIVVLVRLILKILYIFPVKSNRLFFMCYTGQFYSCNPKYISEYMVENYNDEFEYVWAYSTKKTYELIPSSKYIKKVKFKCPRFLFFLLTSRIIIFNDSIGSYLPIRKKQYLINTWHGVAYKRIDVNLHKNPWRLRQAQLLEQNTSLYISSCDSFSKIATDAFATNLGKIFECGMPRNDILFSIPDNLVFKTKEKLGIKKNDKIVLFAPTFRRNGISPNLHREIDLSKWIECFENKWGGEWTCLYRAHIIIDDKKEMKESKNILNVSDYPDMQELLCISDVLITDYSSSMWDISLISRPCFIYAPDLDDYKKEPGLYMPVEEWPFPIACDEETLFKNINNFDEKYYIEKVQLHHKKLGSFESGKATIKITNKIREVCNSN